MLHDGQQFHMGKAHLLHIGDEFHGKLQITQGPVLLFRTPAPRSEMDFINRHRLCIGIPLGPLLHPSLVIPDIPAEIGHHARRSQIMLGKEPIRIGLQKDIPMGAANLEFVMLSLGNFGNKNLPDSGTSKTPHHMTASVPSVEIADNTHSLGIRGPDHKRGSLNAIYVTRMRPQNFVSLQMFSLPKQIKIQLPECRGKRIRIAGMKCRAVCQGHLKGVLSPSGGEGSGCLALEQPLRMHLRESKLLPIGKTQSNARRPWIKDTGNAPPRLGLTDTKNAMGIAMPAFQQRIEISWGHKHGG